MNLGYYDDPYSDRHESTRSASYIPISRCFSHSTPISLWDFPIILDGLIRMSSIESVSVLKENLNRKSNLICVKLFIFLCNFQRGLDEAPLVLPVLPSAVDGPTSCRCHTCCGKRTSGTVLWIGGVLSHRGTPKSSIVNGIFHDKPSSYWVSLFMEPPLFLTTLLSH